MTAYDVYIGRIEDPAFLYSGRPESWRKNIALISRIGGGMSLMLRVIEP